MSSETPESLRFEDVATFLTVHRTRSISAAARELEVTPSQVSKAVARLERYVGQPLLSRGSRGVAVTLAALSTIPALEEVEQRVRDLRARASARPSVRLATSSSIVLAVVRHLCQEISWVSWQCLETDAARIRALASLDAYDVALLSSPQPLGDLFSHEAVGTYRSALYARPSLARSLGGGPVTPQALRDIPFVMPVLLQEGTIVRGRDDCPMRFGDRTPGHSAQTFGVALELAASSDELVFGPEFAARQHVDAGRLTEVPVEGWDVRWTLYLSCHTERVQTKVARKLHTTLERWLEEARS